MNSNRKSYTFVIRMHENLPSCIPCQHGIRSEIGFEFRRNRDGQKIRLEKVVLADGKKIRVYSRKPVSFILRRSFKYPVRYSCREFSSVRRSSMTFTKMSQVASGCRQRRGANLEPAWLERAYQAPTGCSQFTIHVTPNLSTSMPKPAAQNVGANGIATVPPADSALNSFSPSFTSLL